MKKIFLSLIFAVAIIWTGKADSTEIKRTVSFEELPTIAQIFLRTHFGDLTVSYIEQETKLTGVRSYEVKYTDLSEVELNGRGEWKKVERENVAVPDRIIPEKIRQFVQKNHVENFVKSIEKDHHGYELELNSGLELKFDAQQNFLRYDD